MKIFRGERCADTRQAYAAKIGLPLFGLAAVIAFTRALFSHTTSDNTNDRLVDIFCTPSGNVHVRTQMDPKVVNPQWDPSLFLSITLGFGSYSFAAAKGIDICWDLIVGRGGQILLAILAYPVIRRSLSSYMERRSVQYRVYTSLAFDKISLITLHSIVRDLIRRPCPAMKRTSRRLPTLDWHFLGLACVLMYILAFPTMVSVMTGYQASYTPFVTRPDDKLLMKASELRTPQFVIKDGHRINLQDDMPVYPGDVRTETLLAYAGTASYAKSAPIVACSEHLWQYCFSPANFGYGSEPPDHAWYHDCSFTVHCGRPTLPPGLTKSSQWEYQYSHYTESNITLSGKTWELPAPPLNIITQIDFGFSYGDKGYLAPIPPPTMNYLSYGDVSLNSTYLKENSVCQPSDQYQWGFSSLLMLVFCLLTASFATILNLLHWNAFWNSRTDRYRYDANHYRDAVDLVRELETTEFGDMVRDMPARDLSREIERHAGGVCLDTQSLPLSRKDERKHCRQAGRSPSGLDGKPKHMDGRTFTKEPQFTSNSV